LPDSSHPWRDRRNSWHRPSGPENPLEKWESLSPLNAEPAKTEKEFYQGKFYTFRYFFGCELPKTEGLVYRLIRTDGITVSMRKELFTD
jgi:hypothetical protein